MSCSDRHAQLVLIDYSCSQSVALACNLQRNVIHERLCHFGICTHASSINSSNTMDLKPGKYRHYKGQYYEVIGTARHSETEEELVVYRALYGPMGLWVRPLNMFCESVQVGTESVPRFSYVGDAP